MITKMKKVMLLTPDTAQDVDIDLTRLGQLGVVHITPFQPAQDESIERVVARIKQLQTAIATLNRIGDEAASNSDSFVDIDSSNAERGDIAIMEEVLNAENSRVELENLLDEQNSALDWYSKWGKVREKDLEKLSEAGVSIKLYMLDKRELKGISGRGDIQHIGMINDKYQVVFISDTAKEKLEFEEITIPPYAFDDLEDKIGSSREQLNGIEDTLKQLQSKKQILQDALEESTLRFDVRNIHYSGLVIENQIRCWKGFMPEHVVDAFVEMADENRWGYIIEDPSKEDADEVPTLIRSPKWAERIRPVMNFMGLIPGYKELDVSKIFMLFFTSFAGILVGDAGYGVIFLLLTLMVHARLRFKKKVEIGLLYSLSASIMIWGILTGTYFGSELIADIPLLSRLRINKLASFGGDGIVVQKVMFLIGAVHLSIGHLQLAWKYINSVKAIAQLGWIAIIWGLNLIVNQMVLGIPAPGIMIWLFIGGALLVALFSNPGQSFFKGILSSLGSLPLSIINGFSDIISYIRLYAVGLATVLMATSFNQMAIGDGISTIASGIGAVIVLILGHGLNMILAGMAVIVHGVRLNMLEYAGHADVEFSGTDYDPFKLKQKKQ
jgi:V/A-type H+/Na+-transporting ATPase subunit I